MTGTRDRRLLALAAGAFFALALIGRVLYPSEPDFVGAPASIAPFYQDNVNALLASNTIYMIGMAVFIAFAGTLATTLRRSLDGALPSVAFGGAVAGAALMLAAGTADIVAALRVQQQDAIDPQVAAVMWDLNSALFGLGAPMAFAVLVLAVAVAGLRGTGVPRWLAAVSVILGVALVVPPISYIAVIVFIFWVPAVGVAMLLKPEGETEAAGVTRGVASPA